VCIYIYIYIYIVCVCVCVCVCLDVQKKDVGCHEQRRDNAGKRITRIIAY